MFNISYDSAHESIETSYNRYLRLAHLFIFVLKEENGLTSGSWISFSASSESVCVAPCAEKRCQMLCDQVLSHSHMINKPCSFNLYVLSPRFKYIITKISLNFRMQNIRIHPLKIKAVF